MTRAQLSALVDLYWGRLAQLDALDPSRVRLVRLYRRALLRLVTATPTPNPFDRSRDV
jgi:hypothetical protein